MRRNGSAIPLRTIGFHARAAVREVALVLFLAGAAHAQNVVQAAAVRTNPTREQLEAFAKRAEYLASSDSVAVADRELYQHAATSARSRLADGDFHTGDIIKLQVEGEDSLSGTFVVRDGDVLILPGLAEVPLHGILRGEIASYLTTQIARYVRRPVVHATPLLRLAVLGEVRNPGFYSVPADVPLTDALMAAGGPTPNADVRRSVIKRDVQTLISARALTVAFGTSTTIDQLGLRGGDQVVVGARSSFNWSALLQGASAVTAIAALLFLRR